MIVKDIMNCPKCKNKPFIYDIVKIYKEKINGKTKHRVRCAACGREFFLPYIKIKKKKVDNK